MKFNILIAEDQEDSRFYLKSLLEAKGHQITEAETGKIALRLFQTTSFDLVITDIDMPEMDGLTLLRAIKNNSPETPVIIISVLRETASVTEALRSGACDYITKPYEEADIYKSIDRVTRLGEANAIHKTCIGYLAKESKQFVFRNNPDDIRYMAQFLSRDLAMMDLKSEMQSVQISLIEAINNAVFHGNLEISSNVKNHADVDSFETFNKLAKNKINLAPFKDRKVTIDYSLDEEKVCYVIRDEGPGFDHQSLSDPLDPESFLKPSGRGLLMIRTFCDEVSWNEKGNEITLVKYRDSEV